MPRNFLTTTEVLKLLAETVPRIEAAASELMPSQFATAPSPGEWSLNQMLAHLRSCADVWGGAILAIGVEGRPVLRAINPLTWIKSTDYLELPFSSSFRSFSEQRAELLHGLEQLSLDAWSRASTVTGAGKALERTPLFYGRWLAGHERSHWRQIERIADALSRGAGPSG